MAYPMGSKEQRKDLRVNSDLPARISIGSQLTVQGRLKDLSLTSAFITIKSSIFLKTGDVVGFAIQASSNNADDLIEGLASVFRIVAGEGLAVYFTKMDESSSDRLKKILYTRP